MKKLIFLIATLIIFSSKKSTAQGEPDSTVTLARKAIVSASFQHRSLPDIWDINYFGLTGEIYLDDYFSYSGSLYFGKGSDNLSYVHFPLAGGVLLLPFVILYYSTGIATEIHPLTWFKLLMLENVYYNIDAGNKVVIAPYLTLLGADGEEHEGDGEGDRFKSMADNVSLILSSGVGINIKVFLTERFAIASNLSVKRFFAVGETTFVKGNHNGYTFGIKLGYVF